MKINPFARSQDPVEKEIEANIGINRMNIASGQQNTGADEQIAMEYKEKHAELTKWQQDLSEEMQIMVHRLRSEIKDSNGDWVKIKSQDGSGNIKDMEPICSEDCVWRLVAMLEPSTSKNLMMSKYDKEAILRALLDLSNAATLHLISNRKQYDIRMSDLSPIMQIFKTAATPTYFRALGGNEKEYLKGIRKDTYLHTEGDPNQKKKGLLG